MVFFFFRKINSKMQQKKAIQQSCQMSAPDRQFTATPLSSSERWRPAEGAPTGHSSRSFTHSSYSGQNLPCETRLMDYEDHVSTTPERVKQVPPPAVGVSSIYTKEMELASPHMIPASIQKTIQEEKKQLKSWMKEAFKNKGLGKPPHAVRENTKQTRPSLPAMHSASAQVTIKKEETQGESWVEKARGNKGMVKVLEGNGPQSPMLEVQQQPDGLQDTYKEQVNQLQQELEEMKRKCEKLQVMETELQRRKAEEPPATHRPSSAHLCPYASLVRD
nr:uncharacterized protein LOC111859494 isoform X4 [Paramormyrops kingsleyae]